MLRYHDRMPSIQQATGARFDVLEVWSNSCGANGGGNSVYKGREMQGRARSSVRFLEGIERRRQEKSNAGITVTPAVSKTERVWLLQGLEKDNVALRADSSCL